jgi:hypothetical protein
VLDNASNNDTTIHAIAQKLKFNATLCRLCCGHHMHNLISQMLLWGKNAEAYNNDTAELANKTKFMQEWRRDGPLGKLLSVITSIKTPQQYALFESFSQLIPCDLADRMIDNFDRWESPHVLPWAHQPVPRSHYC